VADFAIDYDALQSMATSLLNLKSQIDSGPGNSGPSVSRVVGTEDLFDPGAPETETGLTWAGPAGTLGNQIVGYWETWQAGFEAAGSNLQQISSMVTQVATFFFDQDAALASGVNMATAQSVLEDYNQQWQTYGSEMKQYLGLLLNPTTAPEVTQPTPVYTASGTVIGTNPPLAPPSMPAAQPPTSVTTGSGGDSDTATLSVSGHAGTAVTPAFTVTGQTATVADPNSAPALAYSETTTFGKVWQTDSGGEPLVYDYTEHINNADGSVDNITVTNSNAAGQATMTDASGFVQTYGYDAVGNLVSTAYNRLESNGATETDATFTTYDAAGNTLTTGTAVQSGTTWTKGDTSSMTYDAFGEVVGKAMNGGVSLVLTRPGTGSFAMTMT